MAARSIWNGTVAFGAVAIPVKLFAATEHKGLAFKEVRAADGARISHRRVGARSGDEVPYADLEKGFDTGSELVLLSKTEVSAADGSQPKVITIERFVRASEIDPVYYDKPYHLGAGQGGDRAYRVLLEALQRSERVGIGRIVLRSREQLVALRPLHGVLGLQTMRFADELVAPDELELPEFKRGPTAKDIKLAGALVEMLAGEWDPDAHHDTYRDAVLALIEAKAEGRTVTPTAAPARDTDTTLSDALQASLETLGAPKPAAKPRRAPATGRGSGSSTRRRSPTDKPGPPTTKRAPAKRGRR